MICHKPQLNWNYLHQLSHPLGAAFAVPCWYQIRLLMTLIGRTFAAVHPEHVSSLIIFGEFTPLLLFGISIITYYPCHTWNSSSWNKQHLSHLAM